MEYPTFSHRRPAWGSPSGCSPKVLLCALSTKAVRPRRSSHLFTALPCWLSPACKLCSDSLFSQSSQAGLHRPVLCLPVRQLSACRQPSSRKCSALIMLTSFRSVLRTNDCSALPCYCQVLWPLLTSCGSLLLRIFPHASARPPRVLTRSFPLIPAPSTAGVPCSYWTLACIAASSTLHSLSGQLLQASGLPPASFRPHLTVTPLPLAAPFPLPGGSGTFTP